MSITYILSKLVKRMHIPAIKNSVKQESAKVASATQCVDVILGKYSYIGNQCTIINTEIGNFCSIADNCVIGGASHPIEWVSTSPVFHNGINILRHNFSVNKYNVYKKTTIESDVWIGTNCLLKSGVSIGTGAVIGMGSVVTKDIGAYEVWAGNPAKLIKKRFSEDVILKLLESKWWEKDDDIIMKFADSFNDVQAFMELCRHYTQENKE